MTSSDRYPFTQTRCSQSRRKSLIHSTRFELTCKSISLFSSTYGSIVLNTLEKSTNKILTYDLAFSKCCVIKFRRVREASSTLLEALYANWNRSNWSTTSNFKCLDTTFSKHFAMAHFLHNLTITPSFSSNKINVPTLFNNNNILYSSQQEIKAVVWSYILIQMKNWIAHISIIPSHETHTHTLLDIHPLSLNLSTLKEWSYADSNT